MLIMLTNRCNEGCPHCMQDSNPSGAMMDERTFYKAVRFAQFIGSRVITISGGEPTLHPNFFKYCQTLEESGMYFIVVSNGTWYNDEKIVRQVRRMCTDFKFSIGMQVYTNEKFYKNYAAVKSRKPFFDSFGGKVVFDESPIAAMKDLGRAKNCNEAQKMCDESRYFMSCLNPTLLARQVRFPYEYGLSMESHALQICHPLVDFNGDVHLSESWLCPSVGNVAKDLFGKIWYNIEEFKPCGKCKDYKRFKESQEPKIVSARSIIENEE